MAINVPTIDDFDDTTVILTIKKIVQYLMDDLVPGINDNDIISGTFSLDGNNLSASLTKGDGTKINIPAITLPGGGGTASPYPTDIALSLSGNILNVDLMLSDNTHVTGSVDLSSIAGGSGGVVTCEKYDNLNNVGLGIKILQENDSKGYINITKDTSEDNTVNVIVGDVATGVKVGKIPIVSSVTGSVSGNNLTIGVNGVNSSSIELPSSSGVKKLVTSGYITQFISVSDNRINISKDFEIEYINIAYPNTAVRSTTAIVKAGSYPFSSVTASRIAGASTKNLSNNDRICFIQINLSGAISVTDGSSNTYFPIYTLDVPAPTSEEVYWYRMYA